MNLEDKNVTTCQLAVVNQGLKNISEAKTALHSDLKPLLEPLRVESGLGPKIKFILLHSNSNFYLRSNSMQAFQIVGQYRSKPYHEKDNFSHSHT